MLPIEGRPPTKKIMKKEDYKLRKRREPKCKMTFNKKHIFNGFIMSEHINNRDVQWKKCSACGMVNNL